MIAQLVPRHGNHAKVKALEAALVASCPIPISVTKTPDHSPGVLLVLYGAGSLERTALLQKHRAVGGRVLCFDRGYFGRSSIAEQEHYRVSIDRLHVSSQHIEETPDNDVRLARFGITLRDDALARGPVIVAGMGPKSCTGLRLQDWDRLALASAQKRFPKHRVIYRPKTRKADRRLGSVRWRWTDRTSPIDEVLRGASLVIVRHSNVAVDACVAGIPVECEDGAARWLYAGGAVQSVERRQSFLRKLSWWNWRMDEMGSAWKFFLPRLA
jgi:hypothetical protein